ncbi:MAG TPA: hypothetical protein VF615_16200 [Longimicrobiaceae bacterium]|jgi:hypothetical protein
MRLILWLATLFVLLGPCQAAAQRTQHTQLLQRALDRIINLRPDSAIILTRRVLDTKPIRRDSALALKILAGALYPEEKEHQQRGRAKEVLELLVRRFPRESRSLPEEIAWSGLKALHHEVLRTIQATRRMEDPRQPQRPPEDEDKERAIVVPPPPVFRASLDLRSPLVLQGSIGRAIIPVTSTLPARFTLGLQPQNASSPPTVLAETEGYSYSADLEFWFVGKDDYVFIQPGSYRMILTAVSINSQRREYRYQVQIEAPPYPPFVAPRFDGKLHPERKINRRQSLLAGGMLAGITLLPRLDSNLSPAGDIRNGIAAGSFLILGVLAAVLDRGHTVPENVEYNRRLYNEYLVNVSEARANAMRYPAQSYRATMTILPEP